MECNIYYHVADVGIRKKEVLRTLEKIGEHLPKNNISFSLHFIGDKRMRSLNKRYCGQGVSTDVLSFAADEGYNFPGSGEDKGDVFLCTPRIKRQAKENNINYREELSRVLIHGILHLFGYDHDNKEREKKMFALQEKILMNIL